MNALNNVKNAHMITNISKLKSFGIFQDYKAASDLKPFVQYNLFYGWNGSGKSTLAKVFLSITDRKTHDDFPSGEYTISIKDHPDLTHKNITQSNKNVRVFSKDFIDRNVNFEQSKANSILILSQEKKAEMEKYKSLLEDFSEKQTTYQNEKNTYDKADADLKKSLSRWASNVKKSFELIETSNSYYLNYNLTKLSSFIAANRKAISKDALLSADTVKNLKNAIKPEKKADIDASPFQSIDSLTVENLFNEVELLLSRSIFSQQIARLSTNADINQWVKDGLDIHERHKSNNCEFCGQVIPKERLEQINDHFSKEYDDLILSISKVSQALEQATNVISMPLLDTGDLYDEFHVEYIAAKDKYALVRKSLLSKLQDVSGQLMEKAGNPFKIIHYKFKHTKAVVDEYNDGLKTVTNVITKHNLKNADFDESVKKAQFSLELNFVSQNLLDENFEKKETDLAALKVATETKEKDIQNIRSQIVELEKVLLNEAIAADDFNKNLEKFLGRKDISLAFDKDLKGYKITRRGSSQAAKNLSEGEKTAIAFVYFIAKLKESGNQIENTVVVVDDPISSFDSNHLFHSYSYLKKECEKAEQLFILTHNFQYFKLVRDWIVKKNDRKTQADGSIVEKIKANCYSIDSSAEEDRRSTISNANKTLLIYNSEYHYIFSKIHSFKEIKVIDLEKAFLIANLSRKLLETFLTFKFPKGRNDFSQLLQAGCHDGEMREKVYRFINKYSHNQVIDINDGPIDNLLGEGNSVVQGVLKIVEDLDQDHYSEMVQVCA